jgi:predicted ATPase
VCVLYFDPSPDGTTSVKRLRITEDGEFMDRWPRGFFAERDQELLDE